VRSRCLDADGPSRGRVLPAAARGRGGAAIQDALLRSIGSRVAYTDYIPVWVLWRLTEKQVPAHHGNESTIILIL